MSAADPTRRAVIAGAGAALLTGRANAAPQSETVRSPAGDFEGTDEAGVLAFRGIRYGRAERFRAPVPIAALSQPVEAHSFGPVSPQASRQYPNQSEDCLLLDIWTPQADASVKKPVMVYIHGGAYSNGSSIHALNDGRHLATRGDVVVVTVNHRLNVFG